MNQEARIKQWSVTKIPSLGVRLGDARHARLPLETEFVLPFSIVSDVQDAPAHFHHPFHDCCVAPWRFRRHGPPEPSLKRVRRWIELGVHSLGTSSTCAPSPGLVPERTVRTKGSRLFLVVPVCSPLLLLQRQTCVRRSQSVCASKSTFLHCSFAWLRPLVLQRSNSV